MGGAKVGPGGPLELGLDVSRTGIFGPGSAGRWSNNAGVMWPWRGPLPTRMRRQRQSPTLFMPVATLWQTHGQAKEPPRIGRLR
eukprot:8421333-Pyramimonas_sp.AAC.1